MVSSLTSLSDQEKVGRVWKKVPGVVISARECQVGRDPLHSSGEERECVLLSFLPAPPLVICTRSEEGMESWLTGLGYHFLRWFCSMS